MFGKATDLSAHRDYWGAVVFYFVQLMVLVGFSTVLVHFLGMAGFVEGVGSFFDGGEVHRLIGSAFILVVSNGILQARGKTSDLMSIIFVVAALYLSWDHSVLLGMIPVALLTTMKS